MIKKLKLNSEFSKNVLTLMTGTTIAQAIPIAISPILTRIYTPEDFGVFSLYVSIVAFLSVLVTGRYELAIMLPKKKDDALQIVFLSIFLTIVLSLMIFIFMLLFHSYIVKLLGNSEIERWLYWVPLSVFLVGLYQSLNYWHNREKSYKTIAKSKVSQSFTTGLTNLGLGYENYAAAGLIFGNIMGSFIATSVLAKFFYDNYPSFFKQIHFTKIYFFIKKYKKQPLINLPNALIDQFRLVGINVMVSNFYSVALLGQFSLAWKMLQTPMSLLSGSLSQVFFQKVTVEKKENLYFLVKKFIIKSSFLSIPIFLFIYFYSVDIFMFMFGEKWKIAGEIASILVPWMFLNFISSPISSVYLIINKQEIVFLFSIFYMLIPLSIIFLFHSLDIVMILTLVSYTMSFMLVFFILLLLFLLKKLKVTK